MMKPQRYPYAGVKKEDEIKKIANMFKKVNLPDFNLRFGWEYDRLMSWTNVYVELAGFGKIFHSKLILQSVDFDKDTMLHFKVKVIEAILKMTVYEFKEKGNYAWANTFGDILTNITDAGCARLPIGGLK